VVGDLPPEAEPHLAAEVYGERGRKECPHDKKLWRKETHDHGEPPKERNATLFLTDLRGCAQGSGDCLRWIGNLRPCDCVVSTTRDASTRQRMKKLRFDSVPSVFFRPEDPRDLPRTKNVHQFSILAVAGAFTNMN
jgi:hypothetical protein